MSENRLVAGKILSEAWDTISKKRPGVHGSAEMSFQMIADLWTVYLRHATIARNGDGKITAVDVAQMMSLLKKARAVFGDVTNADNFVDDTGYSALAGMLQLPDPAKMPVDENEMHNSHEHLFPHPDAGADIDEDGFVACIVEGCTAKKQVRKSKTGNKTDAKAV